MLFMCCHPALSPTSQIALTLRAVGDLATAEIARAFLVPESAMTRRISRAKQQIKASAVPFRMPAAAERAGRLAAVLHVLYLIFSEGYASTSGPDLQRAELAAEAIRLARIVHRLLPGDGEVTGLLALMLLTDSGNPVVALHHAVAVAMVHGPRAGLGRLAGLEADERIARDHRLPAVRAHLLEMAGERAAAREAYLAAASRAGNLAQQRYLHARAARLAAAADEPNPESEGP